MSPFVFATLLIAADPAILPLPKDQASDGWVKLFDGTTTFGWTIDGEAKVENGELILGGATATKASVNPRFDNFELRVIPDGAVDKSLHIDLPPGRRLRLSRLDVKPAGAIPLCNNKDLTGWKTFPGDKYKTKYTFTPEGWINAKDGPGDLQTAKQYQDFIFQGDIRTNGTHLNSGIFFRCLPDQYQQGYECQIRNQFDKDPFKPFDFGTGAIYRRVAVRAVVAKDREWFALTILARGNRFTTWVDGWMTADWVDERKPAENARNGYRAGAGHISLQGHDPTTDVDFRNLRIGELKGN